MGWWGRCGGAAVARLLYMPKAVGQHSAADVAVRHIWRGAYKAKRRQLRSLSLSRGNREKITRRLARHIEKCAIA